MARNTKPAISAYSIAVAPESSRRTILILFKAVDICFLFLMARQVVIMLRAGAGTYAKRYLASYLFYTFFTLDECKNQLGDVFIIFHIFGKRCEMPKRESWIRRLAASMVVMVMLPAGAFNTLAAEEKAPENGAATLEKAREEAESFNKIQDALEGEDATEALKDLEFLARKGNVKARLLLGDLYLAGEKVAANDSMAWQWYKRAAEKDSLKGQFMVAELYRMGLGVPFSLSNAAKWYGKAADKGHVESQKMLGQIFAGKLGGGLIDFRKAEQWLAKAAEQGDFDSELTLYQMYDGGYKPMSTLDQELSDEEADPNASAGRIRKTLLDALNKRAPVGGKLEVQGLLRVREAGDGWFNVSIPPLRLTNARGGAFFVGRAKLKFKPVEDQLDAAGEPRAYQVAEVEQNLI
ncbi:MAG TPA: sel1 repeat family protein, partial [Rhodospirillales bacterium]|nr:sel1 repeat family protein [Rhodospirillales bacterium]